MQAEIIKLGRELNFTNAAAVKQEIESCLAGGREPVLDAAALQKVDTAGLQMLMSLRQFLETNQRELKWQTHSPVIESAASLIGVSFDMPSEAEQGFGFF